MPLDKDYIRELNKQLKEEYGMSLEEVSDVVKRDRTINKWGDWVAKTAITALTLAFIYAVWEGVRHFIKGN